MKNYRFIITGRVQGVFYRASVHRSASKNNFCGYVKNLDDGSVEACVTCEENRLDDFLEILHKGSPLSRVDDISKSECDEIFTDEFEIRY